MPDVAERARLLPSLAPRSELLRRVQMAGAGWSSGHDTSSVWKEWFTIAANSRSDTQDLAELYEVAANDGIAPTSVCSVEGPIDLTETIVTASQTRRGERTAGWFARCRPESNGTRGVAPTRRTVDVQCGRS